MLEVGLDEFKKLQAKLASADKKLVRRVRKRLRDVAGPIGRIVLEKGAQGMPARGGLRAILQSRSKSAMSAVNSGVALRLSNKDAQITMLNKGFVRHPVFPRGDRTRNQWHWVNQSVPDKAYTKAFESMAPKVRQALIQEIRTILKEMS